MTVKEVKNLCSQSLEVEIYPLGLYGTVPVYFRGKAEEIPDILLDREAMSIMPLSCYLQGISIEFDENLLNKLNKLNKEDEQ